MRNPRVWLALVTLAALGLTVLAVVQAMRQAFRHTCEVCITFNGQTQCRAAQGATEEAATRTATENACAFVSSGMTQSIQCANTVPDRIDCGEPAAPN